MPIRVHPEGYKFIAVFAVLALILFMIAQPLGWVGVILTAWCVYFFRDLDRYTPVREGLVISPADGIVQMITRAAPPPELDMGDDPRTRISIFMNVFDCHVNRMPMDGELVKIAYTPGKFLNAALDKASTDNERQSYRVKLDNGKEIAMVQIAGLVARRIVGFVTEGRKLKAGERFGLIRFGSRVDVYLEDGSAPLVCVGQRCFAGETVIADLSSDEAPRTAEVR